MALFVVGMYSKPHYITHKLECVCVCGFARGIYYAVAVLISLNQFPPFIDRGFLRFCWLIPGACTIITKTAIHIVS